MTARHCVPRRRLSVSRAVVMRILGGLAVVALGVGVTVILVDRRQDFAEAAAPRNTAPALAIEGTLTPGAPAAEAAQPLAPAPRTSAPTTSPPPPPAPAAALVGSTTGDDGAFLGLLEVSGYNTSPDRTARYIDTARQACSLLADGLGGSELVTQSRRSAAQNGVTEQQAEGLVYIGVATYCASRSDRLP